VVDAGARVASQVMAITRHWELKLLALAFSVALWFFVMTSEKSDLIVSAPIQLDGLPSGLVVAGEQPEAVDVQLHGLRAGLVRLAPDQLRVRLNLVGAQPGEVLLRVLPEQIAVPPGITVVRVNPSRIRLTLAYSAVRPAERRIEGPRS